LVVGHPRGGTETKGEYGLHGERGGAWSIWAIGQSLMDGGSDRIKREVRRGAHKSRGGGDLSVTSETREGGGVKIWREVYQSAKE